jgi:hypothetical protein
VNIDQYGNPDFEAPFDGRTISSFGGQSGRIVLLNGQRIVFPWKAQQELPNSEPAYLYVNETTSGGLHEQDTFLTSAYLQTGAQPAVITMAAPYVDSSAQYCYISLRSGIPNGSSTNALMTIRSSNGADGTQGIYFNSPAYFSGDVTVGTGIVVSIAHLHVTGDAGGHTSIKSGSGQDIELITGSTSGNLTLTSTAGNATLTASTGNVTLTSSEGVVNMSLFAGAGTTHTPTLSQGASSNISKTTTYSKVWKIGRLVIWQFLISATAAGTGGSAVKLSLPYTAAQAGNMDTGGAYIYNGATNVQCEPVLDTTTTLSFVITGGYYTTAIASGNVLTGTVIYAATS